MMELILNIVWLVMSAAIFAVFIRGARLRRVGATVAICVAALSFPIISITDDLCNDIMIADASSMRRTTHRAEFRPFAIAADVQVPAIILVEVMCCGIVAAQSPIASAHRALTVIDERGPPLRVF